MRQDWRSSACGSIGLALLQTGLHFTTDPDIRLNLVTPEATLGLLVALSKTSTGPVFRQSLPISGLDGTLGGNFKPLRDRVFCKNGFLNLHTLTIWLSHYCRR